ncbi:MAG: glycoside hydrolase family 16 protein [Verrucomicrobiota bacterium]
MLAKKLQIGIVLLTGLAFAHGQVTTTNSSSLAGKAPRPKFKSKIHIPVLLSNAATPLPPPGYKLVFSDDFNGDCLDTNKWRHRVDQRLESSQRPENVSVRDGLLRVACRKEAFKGKAYTGGGAISRSAFVYGYFEARFKTPAAEGWHTAFWTMFCPDPDRGVMSRPRFLEIDICEQDGGDPEFYSFGVVNHRPDPKRGQTWNGGRWVIENAPDTSKDFHVWACEFTPDKMRFYFDGHLAKEMGTDGFTHEEMNVWLTVIASKLKGDRFVDESKLPNEAVFDYVRVYQNPAYEAAEKAAVAGIAKRLKSLETKPAKGASLNDLN